jgi:hypothetical protein
MKNHLLLGNWNALCDSCGRKFKAFDLQKRWDGLMVCQEDFEQRHPQDLLKVQREKIAVPWSRPYAAEDTYVPEALWTKPEDHLGIPETLSFDVHKYIFNISIDASALNGTRLNAYALNGTDESTPYQTETASIAETFKITLGRFFNESAALAETIAKRLNKNISEAVPVSESVRFAETEHTAESMSFSETKVLSTNKRTSESMTISESQSFLFTSSFALNGSALNTIYLG